jgi:hypothetical protein
VPHEGDDSNAEPWVPQRPAYDADFPFSRFQTPFDPLDPEQSVPDPCTETLKPGHRTLNSTSLVATSKVKAAGTSRASLVWFGFRLRSRFPAALPLPRPPLYSLPTIPSISSTHPPSTHPSLTTQSTSHPIFASLSIHTPHPNTPPRHRLGRVLITYPSLLDRLVRLISVGPPHIRLDTPHCHRCFQLSKAPRKTPPSTHPTLARHPAVPNDPSRTATPPSPSFRAPLRIKKLGNPLSLLSEPPPLIVCYRIEPWKGTVADALAIVRF